MCSERLYTDVEPAAASVAALHWFLAAAAVAAATAATTTQDALEQALEVEHIDDAVPRIVLRLASSDGPDRTPLLICQRLVHAAMCVSRGMLIGVPDPGSGEPCFTALDPARPARCLLDGLIGGIQAVAALYATYVDLPGGDECDEVEWLHLAYEHIGAPLRLAELVPS